MCEKARQNFLNALREYFKDLMKTKSFCETIKRIVGIVFDVAKEESHGIYISGKKDEKKMNNVLNNFCSELDRNIEQSQ